ncbi:hypothetical protein GF374_00065 [Candidatus Woesearchaeota archaeon]|nr:hypothetical protein [Candidatus Woesearchaeota archaeon]
MARPRKWNANKVKLEIKKLHKKLDRRPVKRDSSLLCTLSRQFYGTWNNAMRAAGYSVKDFQNPEVPSVSPELAYFIGLVITDGHLVYNEQRRTYDIRVYTSYPAERDLLVKLIKTLFAYNVKPRKRKLYGFNKVPNYELIISSKKLVLFLHKEFGVPLGAKSKNIQVPAKLAKNKSLFFNFFRGIIDGDGSINRTITIFSSSNVFLDQLKNILEGKFTCKIRKRPTAYVLAIERQKDMYKLYKKLYASEPYFYYKRKKIKYQKVLKRFINQN